MDNTALIYALVALSLLVVLTVVNVFVLVKVSRVQGQLYVLYETVQDKIDALRTYIQFVNADGLKPTDISEFDINGTEEFPSGTVIAIQKTQPGTYQSSTTQVTVTEPVKPRRKRSNSQRDKRQNTKTHDSDKSNRDKIRAPGVFSIERDHNETRAKKPSTSKRSTKSRTTDKRSKSKGENRPGLFSTDSSYTSFP